MRPRRGDERQARGQGEPARGTDGERAERRLEGGGEVQVAECAPQGREAEQHPARDELDAHQVSSL